MDLQRGLIRGAIAGAALWFVYWTFAYAIHRVTSLNPEPAFIARITAWSVVVPCLITAIVLGAWVVSGLWSRWETPAARR